MVRILISFWFLINSFFLLAQVDERFFNTSNSKKDVEINNLISQANTAFNKKDFNSALRSYQKAQRNLKNHENQQLFIESLLATSECLIELNRSNKAIHNLLEAKEIAFNISYENALIRIYELLVNVYESNNDTAKRDEYLFLLQNLKNGTKAEDLQKLIQEKESDIQKFATDKQKIQETLYSKENEILAKDNELKQKDQSINKMKKIALEQKLQLDVAKLENENKSLILKQKESELKNERYFKFFLLFAIIFFLVLSSLIFYGYKQKSNAHKIISTQQERIKASINYAKRIQDASLPDINMLSNVCSDFFVMFEPRDIVSGDFYWIVQNPLKEHSYFIATVDCTGHGVPGAFMSMIGINLLNEIISNKIVETGEILDQLNLGIIQSLQQEISQNQDGMDMSLIRIDNDERKLYFSGARNSLVYIKNNEIHILKADRRGIGGGHQLRKKSNSDKKFNTSYIPFDDVEAIYLFSDGFPDQIGGEYNEKLTNVEFYTKLLEYHKLPFTQQKDKLWTFYNEWKNKNERLDDVLVVGLKLK